MFCMILFSDLDVVLQEESCNSADKGWKCMRKTDEGDEIWRRSVPEQTINLVKVGGDENIYHFIYSALFNNYRAFYDSLAFLQVMVS